MSVVHARRSGPGTLYKYEVEGLMLPDPASRSQPQGVYGPSEVVLVSDFKWSDEDYIRPRPQDLVYYEIHIGTFTEGGFVPRNERSAGALVEFGHYRAGNNARRRIRRFQELGL